MEPSGLWGNGVAGGPGTQVLCLSPGPGFPGIRTRSSSLGSVCHNYPSQPQQGTGQDPTHFRHVELGLGRWDPTCSASASPSYHVTHGPLPISTQKRPYL